MLISLLIWLTTVGILCAARKTPRFLSSAPQQGKAASGYKQQLFRLSRFPPRHATRSYQGETESEEPVVPANAVVDIPPQPASVDDQSKAGRRLVWAPWGLAPREIAWAEIQEGSEGAGTQRREKQSGRDDGRAKSDESQSQRGERHTQIGVNQGTFGAPADSGKGGSNDCSVLPPLYASMSGPAWLNGQGWTSTVDAMGDAGCCAWYGVTCSNTSRITRLQLGHNGLIGPLSGDIFELGQLEILNLSGNALSNLPDSFASLPHLTNLDASNAQLNGSIPLSLLTSKSLKALDLGGNGLTGPVNLNAPRLTGLDLSDNQLSSVTITSGASLTQVRVPRNRLTGPLPNVENASNLTIFDFSDNQLSGPMPSLSSWANLRVLNVKNNLLTGSFPPTLTHNPQLHAMYLERNQLSGPFPAELAPSSLTACYVQPNDVQPCTPDLTADPASLAAKCHIKCVAPEVKVMPLPGEAV